MKNNFANSGNTNFRRTTLDRHQNPGTQHSRIILDKSMSVKFASCVDNSYKVAAKSRNAEKEAVLCAFRTVYFLAKKELPNFQYADQVRFLALNGVPGAKSLCLSDKSVKYEHAALILDMHQNINYVISSEITSDLKNASCYGLILDESTDVSVIKKLSVFVRYVCPKTYNVLTRFLCHMDLPDGTANNIVKGVTDMLLEKRVPISNLTGLGNDGASVMTGRLNGVGVKLREEAAYLVHVHCVAHRLAANNIETIKSLQRTLGSVYKFYTYSAVRYHRLREIGTILDDTPTLKLIEPKEVRWLSSANAVAVFYKTWTAIVQSLENEALHCNDGNQKAKAKGLHSAVTDYKFVRALGLLCDVLTAITMLSKKMQSDNIRLTNIIPLVNACVFALRERLPQSKRSAGGPQFICCFLISKVTYNRSR